MLQVINSGGLYMWLLVFIGLVVVGLTVKKTIDLFIKKERDTFMLENGINAILFWGGIAAVLGFFIHFVGVSEAMVAISRANDISPAIVSRGYALSLLSVIVGLFIFMIAGLMWFVFRWRFKAIVSKTVQA